MATNQEGKHAAARTLASTSSTFNGDMIAWARTVHGAGPNTTYNEAIMIAAQAAGANTESQINGALNDYAADDGFDNWDARDDVTV